MAKYFLLFLIPFLGLAQKQSLDRQLFESYSEYQETSIETRRFKHKDNQPLIDSLKERKDFEITVLGRSIQGRNISMISVGEGQTQILLWSQMHGDESPATASIFDIINYLKTDKSFLENVKVHLTFPNAGSSPGFLSGGWPNG